MPAAKKDPTTRARRNKASTASTLRRTTAVTNAEDYASLTVAKLRAIIDDRNNDRDPDQQLSRRGNKADLVQALVEDDSPTKIPRMPPAPVRLLGNAEGWHEMTIAWWDDIWSSPMAKAWDDSDVHNVYVLAALYDDIWQASSAAGRKEAATEYRLQRKDLGLTPYDCRRLEWTIEGADEARDRGEQRRRRQAAAAAATPTGNQTKATGTDPRAILSAVK